MAIHSLGNESILHSQRTRLFMIMCIMAFITLVLPSLAMAQGTPDATSTVCGFASSINKILNAISIIVVTIAVIFSGYQIAFAHKRISDVAPVMIGAILIGAAGQIAKLFLADSTTASGATQCTANLITHALNFYA
ncbi:TrbC/VirB2 family protein [Rhodanobacter sp. Col0626]|uniref:TrbC/VirB2 family protein n=1 Tax=Rhodanobacter sp. Col0626 TaxID=3415679 RepID=UPI003CE7423A